MRIAIAAAATLAAATTAGAQMPKITMPSADPAAVKITVGAA